MKKKLVSMALVSAWILVGCGGGSDSSDSSPSTSLAPTTTPDVTPAATPTTTPATTAYTTLQDLEFKTLTLEENWHTVNETTNTTFIFKETYSENGYLTDEQSSQSGVRLCTTLEGAPYTYMCATVFSSKAAAIHIFSISDKNSVSGNFAYSKEGDTDVLIKAVSTRESSHAWITGSVATTNNKMTAILNADMNEKKLPVTAVNLKLNKSRELTKDEKSLKNIFIDMQTSITIK